ncbi:MAG: Outer-membrane lipoprotein LolB [Legionellaceae bacterium]
MRIIFFLGFLLLNGCVTHIASPTKIYSWKHRLSLLSHLSHWHLQGAVALRTVHKAWSVSFVWQQQSPNYTLHLFGPLGLQQMELIGSSSQVALSTSSKPMLVAKNADELLYRELGWHLPVNQLLYWIKGIPVPNKRAICQWDTLHRLSNLKQDHWEIKYNEYTNIQGMDLPIKLILINPQYQLQVKLIIRQWQL